LGERPRAAHVGQKETITIVIVDSDSTVQMHYLLAQWTRWIKYWSLAFLGAHRHSKMCSESCWTSALTQCVRQCADLYATLTVQSMSMCRPTRVSRFVGMHTLFAMENTPSITSQTSHTADKCECTTWHAHSARMHRTQRTELCTAPSDNIFNWYSSMI
jgi:hypothetical protein